MSCCGRAAFPPLSVQTYEQQTTPEKGETRHCLPIDKNQPRNIPSHEAVAALAHADLVVTVLLADDRSRGILEAHAAADFVCGERLG